MTQYGSRSKLKEVKLCPKIIFEASSGDWVGSDWLNIPVIHTLNYRKLAVGFRYHSPRTVGKERC